MIWLFNKKKEILFNIIWYNMIKYKVIWLFIIIIDIIDIIKIWNLYYRAIYYNFLWLN